MMFMHVVMTAWEIYIYIFFTTQLEPEKTKRITQNSKVPLSIDVLQNKQY